MKNIKVTALTSNKEVLESARITVWKDAIDKEPTTKFMGRGEDHDGVPAGHQEGRGGHDHHLLRRGSGQDAVIPWTDPRVSTPNR